jgi:hypothetical protein
MAAYNKPSFAVSVTPKVQLAESAGNNQVMELIHEDVRRSVGGSGDFAVLANNTVSGGWTDGVNVPVTSTASVVAFTTSTDLVCIKHTGFLFNTTNACVAADTVQIKIDASATSDVSDDTVILAELLPGEAIVLPRPGSTYGLVLASGSAAVGVEITILGT